MTEPQIADHEIHTDGSTVWINEGDQGMAGRFSRFGIDVHIESQCTKDSCIAGPCTLKHWRRFQYLMLEHHNIDVSDDYRPSFLR